MSCPGSNILSEGIKDKGSEHAAEGTAAHELGERILLGAVGADLVGQRAENGAKWTKEMLKDVMKYVTHVQDLKLSMGGALFIEVKVPIGAYTGEEGATGTSDAVLAGDGEICVVDLKFGMGVEVSAERNKQLMLYALGAIEEFDWSHGPFERVRLVISQPRIKDHPSEWSCSVEELKAFGEEVKAAAQVVGEASKHYAENAPEWVDAFLAPSEDACRWCRAKATCPKLAAQVDELFETVDPKADNTVGEILGVAMAKVGLVEIWCKAVRARTESELLAGATVPGFKIVQGRKGPRQWDDADDIEALLKGFKLRSDVMYDWKLISPTTAEKLVEEKLLGPRQWNKLLPLIKQSEGKPSVAPESDKRAALERGAVEDEFEVLAPAPAAVDSSADDLL
jgi:hypothetical protein